MIFEDSKLYFKLKDSGSHGQFTLLAKYSQAKSVFIVSLFRRCCLQQDKNNAAVLCQTEGRQSSRHELTGGGGVKGWRFVVSAAPRWGCTVFEIPAHKCWEANPHLCMHTLALVHSSLKILNEPTNNSCTHTKEQYVIDWESDMSLEGWWLKSQENLDQQSREVNDEVTTACSKTRATKHAPNPAASQWPTADDCGFTR